MDSASLFGRGYELYWSGQTAKALEVLRVATRSPGADARAWYYRGLAELALGDETSGRNSIDRAARLHASDRTTSRETYIALTRVQGPTRHLIDEALMRANQTTMAGQAMIAQRP